MSVRVTIHFCKNSGPLFRFRWSKMRISLDPPNDHCVIVTRYLGFVFVPILPQITLPPRAIIGPVTVTVFVVDLQGRDPGDHSQGYQMDIADMSLPASLTDPALGRVSMNERVGIGSGHMVTVKPMYPVSQKRDHAMTSVREARSAHGAWA